MKYILDTARLRLRQLELTDVDFVAQMLGNPDVTRFYSSQYDRDDATEWLRRQRDRYADDGHGLWLVEERQTGAPVGQVGLCMQELDGRAVPELGYLIDRACWGRGYASEAAAAVRDLALGKLGYPRIVAFIHPDNEVSRAVAQKLGMKQVGLVEHDGLIHAVLELTAAQREQPWWVTTDCRRNHS